MLKRSLLSCIALAVVFAVPQIGRAEQKTVTLSVPSMDCEACPITVRKALEKVSGVKKVTATLQPKEAVVTYDDAKTGVDRLLDATKQAGYPSSVKQSH